jgi:hypothetical protein
MGWFGLGGGGRRGGGEDDASASAPGASRLAAPLDDARDYRRVKVHKLRRDPTSGAGASSSSAAANAADDAGADADDARLAALVPALADLSLAAGSADARDARASAAAARRSRLAREQAHAEELRELRDVYDMSKPNPVDREPHPDDADGGDAPGGWKQELKPLPKRIRLSRYQAEMINYQRMLMRKNVWYYRDRAGVPRGPCPLHVLKDCWVQGVVDENTLVWGHGLADWLPARNVKLLVPMVRTPEVRAGAWLKKTFSLGPALNRARERRAEARPIKATLESEGKDLATRQVERMR